ncbi:MAG TPA: DNA recombination protein RmuC [Casimicrobiaceae bacterium]|jgi:DNA recombination protein RmuC|nr:DNA recombination protein RmuC [Casimicrobiaceae bacterium]
MIESVLLGVCALAAVGCVVLLALALSRLAVLARDRERGAIDAAALMARLDAAAKGAAEHERDMRGDLAMARNEQADTAANLRREVGERLAQFQAGTQRALADAREAQRGELAQFGERLGTLTAAVEQKLEVLRNDNTAKLEQMRATVDEKLQATLEKRLGDSFSLVSERLEQVHKGLGEMQQLAVGVGDLKRVMSNVKMRGGWGEVQLGALLAELLTPAQFATNVATRPGRGERVEFAIALPGRGDDGTPCWLPIDSKFPLDAWQRLQDAQERADAAGVETSRRELDQFFKSQARAIRESYVEPPHTTDFAILFVPTEGLYAEAVSRAGLADGLQREHRVVLAGPTTLAALLNSLQIGFRTLAIEKQSAEVWRTLGAVKTDFGKFGDLLAKTKEKLDKVGETLEDASRKSRTIERKLRNVEALPAAEAERLLGVGATPALDEPDEGGDVDAPSRDAG